MHTDERTAARVLMLHAIFEAQTRATPLAVALDVPPLRRGEPRVRLTYAELDERAGRLAGALATHVRGECVVAILLPRAGVELPLAQLAVLKAGAAWTCIEPGTSPERLRWLLEDSQAVAVIAEGDERQAALAAGVPANRIVSPAAAGGSSRLRSPDWLGPDTLAYVIYTSGTTGHPKGVMIEHRGVTNLVLSDASHFGLGPGDRVAQTSSAAYDSSVERCGSPGARARRSSWWTTTACARAPICCPGCARKASPSGAPRRPCCA